MDEAARKKRYYSISEVADMLEVKQHILRYWESEFSQLRPRKNRAGNRAYTEKDIATALHIKQLLYEQRFTIDGARQRLRTGEDVVDDGQLEIPFERLRIKNELKEIRQEILSLIEQVKRL